MSLLVGQTVASATASGIYTGPQVAVTLSIFSGFIALFIGLTRLGILVDFIPGPAIHGFMTGSSITISIGQWPKLFGITGVNTHDSAYLVFGNFFKHLPETKVDVAFGLVGLLWLYSVRFGTAYLSKRYPRYERWLFFFNIMRNGILVIFGTLLAFLINIGKSKSPISILGTVPSGFTAMAVPDINVGLLSEVASTLPSVVIILILEHVAIAKSFGRISNYKIDPDQEIIAIGAANVIGSFFGAYPNTGSFSRTAITARSGARTPLAGVFSALVVLLCLYALTPAFYYIPDAILSAIIIHAVADLASGPKFLIHLFKISPFESFTFVAAVLITFFTTVEYGIYASVALSIVGLLLRIARPRYAVLGRIPTQPELAINSEINNSSHTDTLPPKPHYVYVRRDHQALRHLVLPPPPGIVIFRIEEALTYPNSGYITDKLTDYIENNFCPGVPPQTKKGDRAWNDRRSLSNEQTESLPELHAVVLDCSAMNNLDSTGAQALVDLKSAVDYFAGHKVEWHFAGISNAAIRNTLIASGFGNDAQQTPFTDEPPVIVTSSTGENESQSIDIESGNHENHTDSSSQFSSVEKEHTTIERMYNVSEVNLSPEIDSVMFKSRIPTEKEYYTTNGISKMSDIHYLEKNDCHPCISHGLPVDRYPFFHWDIESAVRTAYDTQRRDSVSTK
ncbi:hypothetical protein G6F37_006606 [Rhizopus arrhizus]|nr:hypothetical protein G6F38_003212 [Rhizopus arrhizus]KAG1157553.1 hypothetical protein G6F37_006606 [Rhizopus arrhizus]